MDFELSWEEDIKAGRWRTDSYKKSKFTLIGKRLNKEDDAK